MNPYECDLHSGELFQDLPPGTVIIGTAGGYKWQTIQTPDGVLHLVRRKPTKLKQAVTAEGEQK